MANQAKIKRVEEIYIQYVLDPDKYESALWLESLSHIRWIIFKTQPEHCDDIAQKALIYAWQHLDSYDSARASFGQWLRVIAKSTLYRKHGELLREYAIFTQPRHSHDEDEDSDGGLENMESETPEDDDDPEALYVRSRLYDMFADDTELLDQLLEGNSVSESARNLGRSRDAVRWSLKKAKERYAEVV